MWTFKKDTQIDEDAIYEIYSFLLYRDAEKIGRINEESDAKAICDAMNKREDAVEVLSLVSNAIRSNWGEPLEFDIDLVVKIDRVLLSQ